MSTSTQISGQRKKSRNTGSTKVDYITDLPECVISNILSRLPTREAVRTSVLSKDWRYKWTFSYNVELDEGESFSFVPFANLPKRSDKFAMFVDRALLLSQNLQSFRLSCHQKYELMTMHELIRMKTWIYDALSRNIHNLDINYPNGGIVLPDNLLKCYSLRKLVLSITPSMLKVPAETCLPYLTFLKLDGVEIWNEILNSDVVKLNFPVLETFMLIQCKFLNVKFVEIDAPKMTRFTSRTSYDAGVSDYTFNITGGSLVKFEAYGGLPENIVLSGGSEVVFAHLDGCISGVGIHHLRNGGIQIRELVNRFLSLKELVLSKPVAKAIALAKPVLSFPKYYKMERLVMYSFSNAEVLLELLHAAPSLKFLLLYEMNDWEDYDYDAEEYVPSCIVSHLEEVEFDGSTHKKKLEKFILKNAVKLRRMHVASKKIVEKLSTYPRASTGLAIVSPSDM